MTCLSDFLDQKTALEPGWGGPGEVRALLDDGVPLGPGEEEHERQVDEWVHQRMIILEETRYIRLSCNLGSSEEWKSPKKSDIYSHHVPLSELATVKYIHNSEMSFNLRPPFQFRYFKYSSVFVTSLTYLTLIILKLLEGSALLSGSCYCWWVVVFLILFSLFSTFYF